MDIKSNFQILMIDDDWQSCQLVADLLAGSKCRLQRFTDSHAGLREALVRHDLDLIMLDIEMPDPNGLEILSQLKRSNNYRVPVMMVSGHAEAEVVQQALQLGAQAYILKPFAAHELVERINQLLNAQIFDMPIDALAASEAQAPQPLAPTEPAQPSDVYQKSLTRPYQLLLIEDDPQMNKMIADMLEGSVCELQITMLAEEGLQRVRQSPIDLILLDIHLPEMNGLEFLVQLRKSHPQLPVVVISGDHSEHLIHQAHKLGVEAYLTKPFRLYQLIAQIENALKISLFAAQA